jgi:hypothetical protein
MKRFMSLEIFNDETSSKLTSYQTFSTPIHLTAHRYANKPTNLIDKKETAVAVLMLACDKLIHS